MSPFQVPEGPYTIDDVMDSIRRQVIEPVSGLQDRPAATEPAPAPPGDPSPAESPPPDPAGVQVFGESPDDELRNAIKALAWRVDVRPDYQIRSHRPVLGRAIDILKKIFHWGSRPYADMMIDHQLAFNQAVIHAFEAMRRHHSHQLNAALAENDKQHAELREVNKTATGYLQDHERRLQELGAELAETSHLAERSDGVYNRLRRSYDLNAHFETMDEAERLESLDRSRGSFEDIAHRQSIYIEHFRHAPGQVLDVGCGRGELLERLRLEGIEARGIDMDPLMVEVCRRHDVYAEVDDAVSALEKLDDATLGGLVAAQVVEHLFPGELMEFIMLAGRKIAPGGAIVLETVNPTSLAVLAKSYYRDLDHKQPIHPEALKQLMLLAGFGDAEIHYLHPFGEGERPDVLPPAEALGIGDDARDAIESQLAAIRALLWGAQDYYVIARKPAHAAPEAS